MNQNKIIAIYDRVSTDDQVIEKSDKMLKDFAKRNGYNIRTYKDPNTSSKIPIFDRKAGKQLIKDLENNKVCGVIVTKWDRITRILKDGIFFIEFWDRHKFKLLSIYDGEFVGTPDNVFTFKLKCLLAEKELLDLDWRRKIGIAHAKKDLTKYKGGKKGRKWKKK